MRRSQSGMTLVEIMIAAVIGLIGMIVIMQVYALSESRRRTTTSGADAQSNGNIALYGIMRDLQQAGYGLSLESLGCTVNTSFGGDLGNPGTFPLAPAMITDGGIDGSGNALPDTLRILYSTAIIAGKPDIVTVNHDQADTVVNMRTNFGVSTNSLVVFWEGGKECALAQVTGFPSNTQLSHTGGSSWNNSAVFPAGGYSTSAMLLNMGGMALRSYAVDAVNNNLQMLEVSANFAGAPSNLFLVASEIVNLQAQYGKDTGAHPGHVAGDNIVDAWDNVAPASGAGGPGVANGWSQVIAVRIALLARAGQYERPSTPGGPCEATTAAPAWTGGTMAIPGGLPSCYRYKMFETIVPLRNVLWGWS